MYQGHLPDGSSVQRHSAGPLYPAVIGVRERNYGADRKWFVIYPGKDDAEHDTYELAVAYAESCNKARAHRNAERQRQIAFSTWADQRNAQR